MLPWFMVTLVGQDQAGIVAQVTNLLYQNGCHLGEASMLRLGGNFTIMMMVGGMDSTEVLMQILRPIAQKLHLHLHVDKIEGQLHQHQLPDVRVTVYGADRVGIVAQVTSALAAAGLNILDLESDVGGINEAPFYVMHIEGIATQGWSALETALQTILREQPDLEVQLAPIEMVVM